MSFSKSVTKMPFWSELAGSTVFFENVNRLILGLFSPFGSLPLTKIVVFVNSPPFLIASSTAKGTLEGLREPRLWMRRKIDWWPENWELKYHNRNTWLNLNTRLYTNILARKCRIVSLELLFRRLFPKTFCYLPTTTLQQSTF